MGYKSKSLHSSLFTVQSQKKKTGLNITGLYYQVLNFFTFSDLLKENANKKCMQETRGEISSQTFAFQVKNEKTDLCDMFDFFVEKGWQLLLVSLAGFKNMKFL